MKRAFALALLVHSLGLFLALGWRGRLNQRSFVVPPPPPRMILLEDFGARKSARAMPSALRIRNRAHQAPTRTRSSGALAKLGIPLREMLGERFAGKRFGSPQQESDARAGHGGEAFDLAREGREHSRIEAIYRKIESLLVYPDELKQKGVQGEVVALLQFGDAGEYLEEPTLQSFRGPPYLRVLIARTLRQAFNEAPARHKGRLEVNCYFRFLINEGDDEQLRAGGNFALGRELAFFRVYHHSKLEWDFGPFHGLGPWAVGADLLWLPRKIVEATEDKAEIDPLEGYRMDPAW